MTYELLFWGNSSNNTELFRLQKKIIRIMMGARNRDFCIGFFKILGTLPLMAQYIYSITICLFSVIEITSWKILLYITLKLEII